MEMQIIINIFKIDKVNVFDTNVMKIIVKIGRCIKKMKKKDEFYYLVNSIS